MQEQKHGYIFKFHPVINVNQSEITAGALPHYLTSGFPPIFIRLFKHKHQDTSRHQFFLLIYIVLLTCQTGVEEGDLGEAAWEALHQSPRKRTRSAKKQATPRDLTPASSQNNVDSTMMDLLLDMSSQMQAMEEYVAQHSQHTLTGNQGSIPERSSVHTRPDDASATA